MQFRYLDCKIYHLDLVYKCNEFLDSWVSNRVFNFSPDYIRILDFIPSSKLVPTMMCWSRLLPGPES